MLVMLCWYTPATGAWGTVLQVAPLSLIHKQMMDIERAVAEAVRPLGAWAGRDTAVDACKAKLGLTGSPSAALVHHLEVRCGAWMETTVRLLRFIAGGCIE